MYICQILFCVYTMVRKQAGSSQSHLSFLPLNCLAVTILICATVAILVASAASIALADPALTTSRRSHAAGLRRAHKSHRRVQELRNFPDRTSQSAALVLWNSVVQYRDFLQCAIVPCPRCRPSLCLLDWSWGRLVRLNCHHEVVLHDLGRPGMVAQKPKPDDILGLMSRPETRACRPKSDASTAILHYFSQRLQRFRLNSSKPNHCSYSRSCWHFCKCSCLALWLSLL